MTFKDLIEWDYIYEKYPKKEFKFLDNYLYINNIIKEENLSKKEVNIKYNIIINSSLLPIKCYYCDKITWVSYNKIKDCLKEKYLPGRLVCKSKKEDNTYTECYRQKNKETAVYMSKIGRSPAQGKKVTEEEKQKRLNTIKEKYGDIRPWSEARKGKSYEE